MIFIDTGAFLARYLPGDANHVVAAGIWEQLSGSQVYTSNHVIDETLTLLARRAGYEFAADRGDAIYRSSAVNILYGSKEDDRAALLLLRKFADQKVSFTDCVSFVLMRRFRIRRAFSFDRHFLSAGFEVTGL